jgi:hypothetical protein
MEGIMLQRIALHALLALLGVMVFIVPWILWWCWPEEHDRGWYMAGVYILAFHATFFGVPAALKLRSLDAPVNPTRGGVK